MVRYGRSGLLFAVIEIGISRKPVCISLFHCKYVCLLSFPKCNDLLLFDNTRFRCVLTTPVSFDALARGSPGTCGIKVGVEQLQYLGYPKVKTA